MQRVLLLQRRVKKMYESQAETAGCEQEQGIPDTENTGKNRRRYQRVQMAIAGRFMCENQDEFPCLLDNISIGGAAVKTAGQCEVGENIILYLDDLGRISCTVVRVFEGGIALSFDLNAGRRNRLADRLTWMVNRDILADSAHRVFDRYSPGNDRVFVQYEDGSREETALEDISLSGASLKLAKRPPVGTNLHGWEVAGACRAAS